MTTTTTAASINAPGMEITTTGRPDKTTNMEGKTTKSSQPEMTTTGLEDDRIHKCIPDPIPNSDNTTIKTERGYVALYLCVFNYDLIGPSERTCLDNGTWSGSVPMCRELLMLVLIIIQAPATTVVFGIIQFQIDVVTF